VPYNYRLGDVDVRDTVIAQECLTGAIELSHRSLWRTRYSYRPGDIDVRDTVIACGGAVDIIAENPFGSSGLAGIGVWPLQLRASPHPLTNKGNPSQNFF
jgi:hypothetical protein